MLMILLITCKLNDESYLVDTFGSFYSPGANNIMSNAMPYYATVVYFVQVQHHIAEQVRIKHQYRAGFPTSLALNDMFSPENLCTGMAEIYIHGTENDDVI